MSRLFAIALIAILLLPTPAAAEPGPGSLIKLSCPANAAVNHPCKAVYFHGHDGKRHAFPNDKAYFTWYPDFSGVQTVSSSSLAAIPLGENVTYRPGVMMVKFQTVDKVYAIALGGDLRWVTSEDVARDLYGAGWNAEIDDVSDAFFADYRFGTDIGVPNAYDRAAELAAASSIDADLDSTHRSYDIATERGTFRIDLVRMLKSRWRMITDTADFSDCDDNCDAKPLADYAGENTASIGIHGTYFCPPDYADCAGKVNTFLSPVYNTEADLMINADALRVHQGPMIARTEDGRYFHFHRTKDFGDSVAEFEAAHQARLDAAISNYPSLIEGGAVIVESESRLEESQRTGKATRGGIGYDDRTVFLVVARSATVVDLAYVLKALGATQALNLDGGGSAALLYDNAYKVGPGRLLPNAIVFRKL